MRKYIFLLTISILLTSCEKEDLEIKSKRIQTVDSTFLSKVSKTKSSKSQKKKRKKTEK